MYSSERIEQTAAQWLAKQDRGEWGEEEQVELNRWLDASTAHRIAYIRLAEAWRRIRQLSALAS
jgi:transmembrane sensor